MSEADWDRPLHTGAVDAAALAPDEALVFLVAFGADTAALEVSEARHRVTEVPEGLELVVGGPETVQAFFDPPIGDLLRERDADLVEQCLTTETCIVLRGAFVDPGDLGYLRASVGLATAALDAGGVAVYNLQNFALFDARSWRGEVFEPDVPPVAALVRVLWSDESTGDAELRDDSRLWGHTRGLRSFGRPDLGVRGVPASSVALAGRFCTAVAEQLAKGLLIPDGATMHVGDDIGTVTFHRRGHLDDPEFNNTHYDIEWPP